METVGIFYDDLEYFTATYMVYFSNALVYCVKKIPATLVRTAMRRVPVLHEKSLRSVIAKFVGEKQLQRTRWKTVVQIKCKNN
jgi:hypothetical protein